MKPNFSSDNYKEISDQSPAFQRVSKFLYNSIYVFLHDDAAVRENVENELGLLVRASLFMGRTFSQGRLWLIWTLNYLSGKGIIESSPRIKEECLRLYSRPDIIWDPCPAYIPETDRFIDSEGIALASWLSNDDTLERYKIQEWAITHIYGLERLMADSKIHSRSLISASFLHSALHFLSKADAFNIFPYKVKPLTAQIMHLLDSTGSDIDRTLGFLIASNEKKYDIPQSVSGTDLKKLSFFMFLYGINISLPENAALPNIMQQPPHESLEVLLLNAASRLNNLN